MRWKILLFCVLVIAACTSESMHKISFSDSYEEAELDIIKSLYAKEFAHIEEVTETNPEPRKKEINFLTDRYDLDSDGVEEVFVYFDADDWCGSRGCSLIILQNRNGKWQEILNASTKIGNDNVSVIQSNVTKGYYDIVFDELSFSGKHTLHFWKWDGVRYIHSHSTEQ